MFRADSTTHTCEGGPIVTNRVIPDGGHTFVFDRQGSVFNMTPTTAQRQRARAAFRSRPSSTTTPPTAPHHA